MATTTLDAHATSQRTRSTAGWIIASLGRLMTRITNLSAAARAARYAGQLAQLSDDELADRGLTRDGIVAHAFRHLTRR